MGEDRRGGLPATSFVLFNVSKPALGTFTLCSAFENHSANLQKRDNWEPVELAIQVISGRDAADKSK